MIVVRRHRAEEKREARRRKMKKPTSFGRLSHLTLWQASRASWRPKTPHFASRRVISPHFRRLYGWLARYAPLERHRIVHVEEGFVVEALRGRPAAADVCGDFAPLLAEQVAPKQD